MIGLTPAVITLYFISGLKRPFPIKSFARQHNDTQVFVGVINISPLDNNNISNEYGNVKNLVRATNL